VAPVREKHAAASMRRLPSLVAFDDDVNEHRAAAGLVDHHARKLVWEGTSGARSRIRACAEKFPIALAAGVGA
jgi:hypothetical protein